MLLTSSRLAAVVLTAVVFNPVARLQSCRLLLIPPPKLISIQPLAFDFTVFDDRRIGRQVNKWVSSLADGSIQTQQMDRLRRGTASRFFSTKRSLITGLKVALLMGSIKDL